MWKYKGANFYTAKELMQKAKVSFSKKTFDFLRDTLRFLPKPIKIADKHGKGTVGFYPSALTGFLRKVEKEHQKGKSYPQIAQELKGESDVLRQLAEKFQMAYGSEKEVLEKLSENWMVEIEPRTGIKPPMDMAIRLSSGEKLYVDVKKQRGEIKIHLYKWDGSDYHEISLDGGDKDLRQLEKIIKETQDKLSGFFERRQ